MKVIEISKEEILKGFKELSVVCSELHYDLVYNGKMKVDDFNDIEIDMAGKKYWVTTNTKISMLNKLGEYQINVEYEIHENSKYGKVLERILR